MSGETWTPVKEAQPEDGRSVLVADEHGLFAVARRKIGSKGKSFWIIGHLAARHPPAMWMAIQPLPTETEREEFLKKRESLIEASVKRIAAREG